MVRKAGGERSLPAGLYDLSNIVYFGQIIKGDFFTRVPPDSGYHLTAVRRPLQKSGSHPAPCTAYPVKISFPSNTLCHVPCKNLVPIRFFVPRPLQKSGFHPTPCATYPVKISFPSGTLCRVPCKNLVPIRLLVPCIPIPPDYLHHTRSVCPGRRGNLLKCRFPPLVHYFIFIRVGPIL